MERLSRAGVLMLLITRLCVERSFAGGDGFGTQVAEPVVYNHANGLIQTGPPEQQSNPHTTQLENEQLQ